MWLSNVEDGRKSSWTVSVTVYRPLAQGASESRKLLTAMY